MQFSCEKAAKDTAVLQQMHQKSKNVDSVHMSGREWQGRTHVHIERLQKEAAVWADAV